MSVVPRKFGASALILVALGSAGLAAAAALYLSERWNAQTASQSPEDAEPAVYQCPMHPSIVRNQPGQCPICGMTLVKLESRQPPGAAPNDGAASQAAAMPGLSTIDIDPNRQQLIGLQTSEVTRGPVGGAWRTVGRVAVDETRVRHINLKVSGFVERIYVDFVGKSVKKGDPLFSVYSPELLSTQEEYLLALKTRAALTRAGAGTSNDGDVLVTAARRKLLLWDVPEAEIERLTTSGQPSKALTFYSPVAGVVTKKDVVQGMQLDAGAMPYEIVDLSFVWLVADVYESELRFVSEKMAATLRLNAFPDREFKGTVAFIDPLLDPKTRTVKVRITFANPAGALRPEMFGEVVLHGAPHDGLWVPPDAIIDSGTDKLVFVAMGAGSFQPRKVEVGDSDGSHVEVSSGLALGERVVNGANFLVDSESRLRASLAETSLGTTPLRPPESARVLPSAAGPLPVAPSSPEQMTPPVAEALPAHEHRGHEQ